MKRETIWFIIAAFLSSGIAVFLGNVLTIKLGLPIWCIFPLVLVLVLALLYSPVTMRDYYAAWQLREKYGEMGKKQGGISCLEALFLLTLFVILPFLAMLGIIWILLYL